MQPVLLGRVCKCVPKVHVCKVHTQATGGSPLSGAVTTTARWEGTGSGPLTEAPLWELRVHSATMCRTSQSIPLQVPLPWGAVHAHPCASLCCSCDITAAAASSSQRELCRPVCSLFPRAPSSLSEWPFQSLLPALILREPRSWGWVAEVVDRSPPPVPPPPVLIPQVRLPVSVHDMALCAFSSLFF